MAEEGYFAVKYVYLLQSVPHPDKRYVGITSDLQERLKQHNRGQSPHTSKHCPWEPVVGIRLDNDAKADAFER